MRWIVLGAVAVAAATAAALAGGTPTERCDAPVRRGVLPEWARAGFSDPEPRIAHVIGRDGELAAILFGEPLVAPPAPDRSNKILWVSRRTPQPGPLRLVADDGKRQVRRVVESGPGPSIVDLPEGCWRISARWSGGEDELSLSYEAG